MDIGQSSFARLDNIVLTSHIIMSAHTRNGAIGPTVLVPVDMGAASEESEEMGSVKTRWRADTATMDLVMMRREEEELILEEENPTLAE